MTCVRLATMAAMLICLGGKGAWAVAINEEEIRIPVNELGQVVKKETPFGEYMQYIPKNVAVPLRVVVLVHGTLGPKEPALIVAERFIKRWISFADEQKAILVGPAFDQENFGGEAGPAGGYRGLFGKKIGADEFVEKIVDGYKALLPSFDGCFYLYGHSAGGQFANRYIVLHPERILGAVISSSGSFAWPDPKIPWGDGMGHAEFKVRWPGAENGVKITPDPKNWLRAASLPIVVLVGSLDNAPIRPTPTQKGNNHVERAKSWVQEMKKLCVGHRQSCFIRLVVVAGEGHSSAALTPAAIRSMGEAIYVNNRRRVVSEKPVLLLNRQEARSSTNPGK